MVVSTGGEAKLTWRSSELGTLVSTDKSAVLDPLPSDTVRRESEGDNVLSVSGCGGILVWRKGFVDIRFPEPYNEHGAVGGAFGEAVCRTMPVLLV